MNTTLDTRTRTLLGLGADTYSDEPWLGTGGGSTTPAPSTSKSTLDKLLSIFKTGSEVYQNVKNPGSTNVYNNNTPPPSPGMSTTAKIAIGGSVAIGVGTAIYFATRKKKSAK